VSGSTNICGASVVYTATSIPNARYTWTSSSNLSVVSGQNTPSLRVNGVAGGAAWVEVRIFNDCGTIRTIRRNVTVGIPAQPGQIRDNMGNGGFFIFCEFQTLPSLSVPIVAGASTYEWVLRNSSNQIINSQNSASITYVPPPGLGLGSYNLQVRTVCLVLK